MRSSRLNKIMIGFIPVFFLFLTALLSFSAHGAQHNDDYFISLFSSTAFPEAFPPLFLSKSLGVILNHLSQNYPMINWFYLIERFIAWASISYFSVLVLRRIKPICIPLCIIFIVFMLLFIECVWRSNFTFVATISTLSGSTGILLSVQDVIASKKLNWGIYIIGIFLFALGANVRLESWLLVCPFLLLIVSIFLFFNRKYTPLKTYKTKEIALLCFAPFVLCGVTIGLGIFCYQDPSYQYWMEYNSLRSKLFDFPQIDYYSISNQLNAIGVSLNDYSLIRTSNLFDQEFFSLEKLKQVLSIVEQYHSGINLNASPSDGIRNLPQYLLFSVIALYLFTICFTVNWNGCIAVALFISVALFLILFFKCMGRLPERVENSIWAYGMVLSVFTFKVTGLRQRKKRSIRNLLTGATALACIVAISCFGLISANNVFPKLLE